MKVEFIVFMTGNPFGNRGLPQFSRGIGQVYFWRCKALKHRHGIGLPAPTTAFQKCLHQNPLALAGALFERLLKKGRITRELKALGEPAFEVFGLEAMFFCEQGEAAFEQGGHGVRGF